MSASSVSDRPSWSCRSGPSGPSSAQAKKQTPNDERRERECAGVALRAGAVVRTGHGPCLSVGEADATPPAPRRTPRGARER